MVKIWLKYFLLNKYDLYKLKLLLRLVVETSSLWHYMFRPLGRISIQGGSGPCVMQCRVSEPAEFFFSDNESSVLVRSPLFHFVTYQVFLGRVTSPSMNPQAGAPPLVGSTRLLIQYFHSHPRYLEAVSFIRWEWAMTWWQERGEGPWNGLIWLRIRTSAGL
jgi:hypothetical protein